MPRDTHLLPSRIWWLNDSLWNWTISVTQSWENFPLSCPWLWVYFWMRKVARVCFSLPIPLARERIVGLPSRITLVSIQSGVFAPLCRTKPLLLTPRFGLVSHPDIFALHKLIIPNQWEKQRGLIPSEKPHHIIHWKSQSNSQTTLHSLNAFIEYFLCIFWK